MHYHFFFSLFRPDPPPSEVGWTIERRTLSICTSSDVFFFPFTTPHMCVRSKELETCSVVSSTNDPTVTDSNDNKAHYTRTMVFIVHPKPRRDLQTVLQGEANTIPLLFLIDCKSRFIIGLVDIDIAQWYPNGYMSMEQGSIHIVSICHTLCSFVLSPVYV
jgi:hypothetical protein